MRLSLLDFGLRTNVISYFRAFSISTVRPFGCASSSLRQGTGSQGLEQANSELDATSNNFWLFHLTASEVVAGRRHVDICNEYAHDIHLRTGPYGLQNALPCWHVFWHVFRCCMRSSLCEANLLHVQESPMLHQTTRTVYAFIQRMTE